MVSMSHLSLHVHSAGRPPAPSKPSFAMPLFTLPLPPKARQLVQAFSAEDVSEDTYIYGWFAVACASKSIASTRLPARCWDTMTRKPRRKNSPEIFCVRFSNDHRVRSVVVRQTSLCSNAAGTHAPNVAKRD